MLLLAYKTNPNKTKRKNATKNMSGLPGLPNTTIEPRGGGGELGLMFGGLVPLASQSPYPYPILVYFLANYRLHPTHFLENVIFAIPT